MLRAANTTHLVARTPTCALAQAALKADLPDNRRSASVAVRDREPGYLQGLLGAWPGRARSTSLTIPFSRYAAWLQVLL